MSQECITLSSDDEVEYICPKRMKLEEVCLPSGISARIVSKDASKEPRKGPNLPNGLTIIIGDIENKKPDDGTIEILDDIPPAEPMETATENDVAQQQNGSVTEENLEVMQFTAESETNGHGLEKPSTSTAGPVQISFQTYLDTCLDSLKGSDYEENVVSKMQKFTDTFYKCVDSQNPQKIQDLETLLKAETPKAKSCAALAVVSFRDVNSFLLDATKTIEISEENASKLKKLEVIMKKLQKRIKRLEEAEVDWDNEDSSFIRLDRYQTRLTQIYKKHCQLLNMDENAGRPTHQPVNISASKYSEINKAIKKALKPNVFPTYKDVEKWIRKCVDRHNLKLSEAEILTESKICFEQVGNLLQKRRQQELYQNQTSLLQNAEDPALKDPTLEETLKKSEEKGKQQMAEVFEKYIRLERENQTVELSADSDDSHYVDSDDESAV